jgi:hypothetical protein
MRDADDLTLGHAAHAAARQPFKFRMRQMEYETGKSARPMQRRTLGEIFGVIAFS